MLYIPPSEFDTTTLCPCCGGAHDVYRTMDEMAWDCLALTLNRLNKQDPANPVIAKKALASRDDVLFLEMELAAALALVEDALSLVPELQGIIGPSLKEAMNASEVYDAIAKADDYWRKHAFKPGTASKWEEAITLALATGVVAANDAVFVPKSFRDSMIAGMNRAGKYYSNNFFSTQVMPSLYNAVDRVVYGDEAGAKASFRIVQQTLDSRLKSVPYWNVVANAAASRAYHYGLLRSGQFAGRTTFRFDAVMDKRTSAICRSMNGRQWTISRGLDLMVRVAEAEHPEDVKTISPWVKASDIDGYSDEELANMGVMVPPLHGRCRSTLVLL